RRADQRPGGGGDLVCRAGDLDPARLAAAAGMDLRLYRPEAATERLCRRDRLRRGIGDAARQHADAKPRQQLLCLVLMDVHCAAAAVSRIFLATSTRPLTAAHDSSNAFFSAGSSWISTMRSTPPLPMTTGTPT